MIRAMDSEHFNAQSDRIAPSRDLPQVVISWCKHYLNGTDGARTETGMPDVKVLSPKSLRDRIVEMLRDGLNAQQ